MFRETTALKSHGLITQHRWHEPCSRCARVAETNNLPLRMCRRTVHVQTTLTSQTNTKITKRLWQHLSNENEKERMLTHKGDPPTTNFIEMYLGETDQRYCCTSGVNVPAN